MPRISKVTTKTGDDGTTGLADGSRLLKSDSRIQLIGEIDELNAFIGLSISLLGDSTVTKILLNIQHDLFDVGAELCQPGKHLITEIYVYALEDLIQKYTNELPSLKEFILPGGSTLLAQMHVCRTVCRRCERLATHLKTELNPITLKYLNRLSDYLFVATRFIAQESNITEVYWQSKYSRKS